MSRSGGEDWGGLLRDYRSTRKSLGYTYPHVTRFTRSQGRRHRRARNPVTQRFYDPAAEELYVTRQKEYQRLRSNRCGERANVLRPGYDIITFDKLPDHPTDASSAAVGPSASSAPRRTAKRRHATEQCKVDYDSLFGKNKRLSSLRSRRDYNILTNRYKQDHEDRSSRRKRNWDSNVLSRHKTLTRDFVDPILQTNKRLPPIVKKEMDPYGFLNPVTNEVKKPQVVARQAEVQRKRMGRHVKCRKQQDELMARKVQREVRTERRKESRGKRLVSCRDGIWMKRGYNIVSNESFHGVDSRKPAFFPKIEERNVWDKLKADSGRRSDNSHPRAAVGGTGRSQ